jgi:hypothetical protein
LQLHPDRDIESLIASPPTEASESGPSTEGALLKSIPELKYPPPQLSSSVLTDEYRDSVNQGPEVDPVEEEHDLSHVELTEHLNRVFIEDKRFFGQAR